MQEFFEGFEVVTADNIINYIDRCAEYIIFCIEEFKDLQYPEIDTNMINREIIDCYIDPYLRIFSDDKTINSFDYLFMLKHKSISEYASRYSEITSYNREFERVLLEICISLKRWVEASFEVLADEIIIDNYEEVDSVLCDYFANDFHEESKRVLFEYKLDPTTAMNDYEMVLIKKKVIMELGDICARRGIK